jgi:biopolymer transport protein ExbD
MRGWIMEFEKRKKLRTHLDIAPLIDIVFLLLIFFMLTANFIMQPGIKINLPEAESSKPQEDDKITVFISSDSRIFVNEEEFAQDELQDIIRLELMSASKKTVVLKADELINLGFAIKVMDIVKQSGAEGIVISTKIKEALKDKDEGRSGK